jgi:hypothetical protein
MLEGDAEKYGCHQGERLENIISSSRAIPASSPRQIPSLSFTSDVLSLGIDHASV